MKLLKTFLIFAFICSIHARKVEDAGNIIELAALGEIDFEELMNEPKFTVTIDENDPDISQSIDIYDQVMDEIEGINDDSENSRDRLNELLDESAGSNWDARVKVSDSIEGVIQYIFGTAASVIDTAVNRATEKFNLGLSGALNFTDRVHTQKKLLLLKAQECAKQQNITVDAVSKESYAKIDRCVPDAINTINATAQTIIGNIKSVRNFMSNIPNDVDACMVSMRESKAFASAKTIFCLGRVTAHVGIEAVQLSAKLATCGTKCGINLAQVERDLKLCYLAGLAAISKDAAEKGYSLGECVVRDQENKIE